MEARFEIRIAELHRHPLKSGAGQSLDAALVGPTGLVGDREWMVVDEHGEFLSQREVPAMALLQPAIEGDVLTLAAPGWSPLRVTVDAAAPTLQVQVWDDRLRAFDGGDAAAAWLSELLQRPARLVRFDSSQRRLSNPRWTDGDEVLNAFGDGFPILVASAGGLERLNAALAAQGAAPVTMARFRPNVVIDCEANVFEREHLEDNLATLEFETSDGPLRLRLCKPCARCPIPDVDPATGIADPTRAVTAALASYRADPRLDGALTFGMNALIEAGVGTTLRVGDLGWATLAF